MIIIMILGIIMGVLSKYSDIAYANSIFYLWGLLSSGLLLWLIIINLFIYYSHNRKSFTILFSIFMISMFISYYLFSYIVVKYIYTKIIIFWFIIFILVLILGNIIFYKKDTKLYKLLFIILSLLAILYDAFIINEFQIEIIILEILLVILFYKKIYYKPLVK